MIIKINKNQLLNIHGAYLLEKEGNNLKLITSSNFEITLYKSEDEKSVDFVFNNLVSIISHKQVDFVDIEYLNKLSRIKK